MKNDFLTAKYVVDAIVKPVDGEFFVITTYLKNKTKAEKFMLEKISVIDAVIKSENRIFGYDTKSLRGVYDVDTASGAEVVVMYKDDLNQRIAMAFFLRKNDANNKMIKK